MAATIGATPAAFADDPRLPLATLATLITAGGMVHQLMRSDVHHRSRAVLDPLTGLLNRASLAERFAELREQALRTEGRLAMVVCDLDRFKQVNDTHGHQVGDAVLQSAAYEMRRSLRNFDLMYRLGGEEFLVLLPGAGIDEASATAERMRAAVAARPAEGVPVSVSFGVSAAEGDDMELDRMLEAADTALLAAKRTGRDRVVRRPLAMPVGPVRPARRRPGPPGSRDGGTRSCSRASSSGRGPGRRRTSCCSPRSPRRCSPDARAARR